MLSPALVLSRSPRRDSSALTTERHAVGLNLAAIGHRGNGQIVPAFAAPWTTCWAHAPARYRGTFLALAAHERRPGKKITTSPGWRGCSCRGLGESRCSMQ